MNKEVANWSANAAFAACGLIVIVAGFAFFESIASMVRIWQTTDAFANGFVVLPLSFFLMWQRRAQLSQLRPAPSVNGAIALMAVSLIWSFGTKLGLQVVTHLAVAAVIPAAVVATFGLHVATAVRFPLCFLLFAVPAGEFLIPWLIKFTANFSTSTLNLLGIPVYQDGYYFYTPSGSYEVAKACSGLKYVIATLMFSVLAGQMLFSRARKTLLFALFAVAAAILANGLRATIVVLLLHYTDLDIAQGTDHLFVGWIIYAILIVILIGIAVRYEDRDKSEPALKSTVPYSRLRGIQIAGISVVFVLVGPLIESQTRMIERPNSPSLAAIPSEIPGWSLLASAESDWEPAFRGFSQKVIGSYQHADQTIEVAVIEYRSQAQGREVTDTKNRVANPNEWTLGPETSVDIGLPAITVREIAAVRGKNLRLIWYWHEVDGKPVDGVLETKLAELSSILRRGQAVSTVLIVSTSARHGDDGRALLLDFVSNFHDPLRRCMHADDRPGACRTGPEVAGLN